jgi:hypothetical protein
VDGNSAGQSSPSIQFRTYSDVPEGPPTNIKLDAPEFGTLRIRWSPPEVNQQNGNLTSYKIRYKTKGRSSKSLIAMASTDVNEHKIAGLDTGLMYQVRIAAQNLVSVAFIESNPIMHVFRMELVRLVNGSMLSYRPRIKLMKYLRHPRS